MNNEKARLKKAKGIRDEILEKATWTCAEHEECKTCIYFYYTCPGLDNTTDSRYKSIPKNERWFIQYAWRHSSGTGKAYMIWLRFKDIGKTFDNLGQIRNLTEKDIKKILKKRGVGNQE